MILMAAIVCLVLGASGIAEAERVLIADAGVPYAGVDGIPVVFDGAGCIGNSVSYRVSLGQR